MGNKHRIECLRLRADECSNRAADLRVTKTETIILGSLAMILRDLARQEERRPDSAGGK